MASKACWICRRSEEEYRKDIQALGGEEMAEGVVMEKYDAGEIELDLCLACATLIMGMASTMAEEAVSDFRAELKK